MSLRAEFIALAKQRQTPISRLCQVYGVSRKTAYKWLSRFVKGGAAGLQDRSSRPQSFPKKTAAKVEQMIVEVREQHPAWGGRKIRAVLQRRGLSEVPAASTITEVLRRHGLLDPAEGVGHRALQRFERAAPNELWQMDFKGHFGLLDGNRCHPLTVLDDHSRFALTVSACRDEQTATVQTELTGVFRRYGLPLKMLADNGPPWGGDGGLGYTPLTVWLLRLDVSVGHGRPYHPQTQGKDERFHRTLGVELLQRTSFADLRECGQRFAAWRESYNLHRPHEALNMEVPAGRYQPSRRVYPETMPTWEYSPGDQVRKVQAKGEFFYKGHPWHLGGAFRGQPIALRGTNQDGILDVYFAHQHLGSIDLREQDSSQRTVRRGSP